MAQPKYGQDNIATITRRHGMRMNRVLGNAFVGLTVLSALSAQGKVPCGDVS
jgi:hypothetical protein